MNIKRLLIPQLFLLTMSACHPSTKLTPVEADTIVKEIRAMMNYYAADVKASGLTAEFKYLDHSPSFFWVPPGSSAALSYDSVATVLKQSAPLFKSIDNAYDTLRILPLSKELATYTAIIRSCSTDTTGQVANYSLIETGVVIKRSDGWKLLNGQTAVTKKSKQWKP